MKTITLLIATSFILSACVNEKKTNTLELLVNSNQINTLQMHAFVDVKTGLTVVEKKFPSEWNVISKPNYDLDTYLPTFQYKIQSDNGLIGFNTNLRQFTSYDDANYAQMMKSYGLKNIKPFVDATTIINQELVPAMQKIGFTKQKTYSEEKIRDFFYKKLSERGFENNSTIAVLVSEWTNNTGKKAMTILVQFVLNSTDTNNPSYVVWNYGTDFLFAPEKVFEQEKTAFIATAINYKENPKWEEYRTFTMRERQIEADRKLKMQNDRANQQYAYFQQRMQDQKAQFESHQNMMKERYAANDANHERFINNIRGGSSYVESNSADDNQRQFINMIREEQVVLNDEGKKYLVEAHSDRYWMNSNGEYIKTDDSFFNPNGDLNLNNQTWELVKKVDK
ncbi:MAG: hypothetical protein GW839_00145 [Flavobacteriales bacterium]|nr:hypothetical protein [Flavobacteriales bacterium]NCQ56692.1 hypothetical protein [Flavobacteriales bacterium]PIV93551.1 MAG: hypothetical protein COW44_08900 [Flavobacteriaceae bacterium CG17_big_fil_post_rev_8_21_14_2_50_33_15]